MYTPALIISSALLLISIGVAIWQYMRYDRDKLLSPHAILIFGAVVASFVWFYPVYRDTVSATQTSHALISSFLASIKILTADGIKDALHADGAPTVTWYYKLYGEILSVYAPFLSFTFVLSFFKSVWTYVLYYVSFGEKHVFSELNDKTLALARSIRSAKGGNRCKIAFADIIDKNEEAHLDLVDGAQEIHAILFRKDIEAVKWSLFPNKASEKVGKKLNFYLVSADESEKIRHTKSIVANYNNEKCSLMLFSDSSETDSLLKEYKKLEGDHAVRIDISRICDARFLTYSYLADHGEGLFRRAKEEDGLKAVNVAIIGFGRYGAEMFRSLFWYSQLPGYKINVTVIDRDENAASRFAAAFPGLETGKDFTGTSNVRYRIDFKSSTYGEKQFIDDAKAMPENTFFFVSLGNDEVNMSAADAIRCARVQAGKKYCLDDENDGDVITTVVYSTDIKKLAKNNISVIGDLDSFYSLDTFYGNGLRDAGLSEHIFYSDRPEIVLVGFGKSEQDAFAEVIGRLGASHLLNVSVFCVNENEKEAFNKLYRNLNAEFIDLESLKDFLDKGKANRTFVICFKDNGIENAHKLMKQHNVTLLDSANVSAEADAFIKRIDLLDKTINNEYKLNAYAFYSSVSKALHRRLRNGAPDLISTPYANAVNGTNSLDKVESYRKNMKSRLKSDDKKRSAENELIRFAEMEHVRWNAYMYTEGFIYNKQTDRGFKMHSNLVDVEALSFEDMEKDI